MRLAILDSGHSLGTKALFALISAASRQPVLDVIKLVKYRPDFYGRPMQRVTHEAMRGPSAWSVGDRLAVGKDCATQYSITDTKCFQSAPSREEEVHVRVEAVLRCVFSDVRTKPPIAKPIKNFVPDTGIPSLSTLIEYKFISTNEEAKRVAEEVLADTRGYVSRDWNKFIYVMYETRRIRSEREWNDLLKSCGAAENTKAMVISGEPARAKYARAQRLKKSKPRKRLASRKH